MENVSKLLSLQRQHYEAQEAYDYFCRKLEAMLRTTFGLDNITENPPSDAREETRILRSVLVAVTHVIYLSHCFEALDAAAQAADPE